jgi:hypothetical protein
MVYGRENINTLAAVLSANPPADLPLRLQVGALLIGRAVTLVSELLLQIRYSLEICTKYATFHRQLCHHGRKAQLPRTPKSDNFGT